jgi:hypothetical protein
MDWPMMDWLILVLVTPLIIVVLVLLYGFVGCGFEGVATGPNPKDVAPSKLTATAIGTDTIELAWQDNSGGAATSFKAERDGVVIPSPSDPKTPLKVSSPFADGGLNDGTDHNYRVMAVLFGGSYDSDPSNDAAATTHPNAPSPPLLLTPQDTDQIDLDWDHLSKSNKTIQFLVEHRLSAGGVWTPLALFGKVSDHTKYSHKDPSLLTPGSGHDYRVTALAVDPLVPHGKPNPPVPSTPVTGSAKTWAVAFSAAPTGNQPGLEGYCLIQKISKILLKNSGTKVTITLRGPSAGSLTINRIYISQVGPGKLYDSAADSQRVVDKDAGQLPVVLPEIPSADPDPNAKKLGPIVYTIPDPPKDLLIAFDISATPGQGNVSSVLLPGTGTEHYFRAATEQASKRERSPAPGLPLPGFTTGLDRLYLVEKIEVL